LKAVENLGSGKRKGNGKQLEGMEQTKVKYTHSADALRNTDLNINNKRLDCKIGTVCVCVCRGYLWEKR
jgi:hypothetical protein